MALPRLTIKYDSDEIRGVIIASDKMSPSVWSRVVQACTQIDDDVRMSGTTLSVPWVSTLIACLEIATLRSQLGFELHAEGEARQRFKQFREDRIRVSSARQSAAVSYNEVELNRKLVQIGFTKRTLLPFQVRDCCLLAGLQNGANFSVPGAGKTTVALAIHLLMADASTQLLIVAPKNAFEAWDSVIEDCLGETAPAWAKSSFIRLDGSAADIVNALHVKNTNHYLITYDRLIRSENVIRTFIARNPTHLILDESHRIKAGNNSIRGRVALSLAPLPVRRDILSGTPAPNSVTDLTPQLDFLWPGQRLGLSIENGNSPKHVLSNLYARTTKHELGLPPVTRRFVHVEMSPAQLAIYAVVRSEAVCQLSNLNVNSHNDLVRARRSVMRLLQISADPIAAALAIAKNGSLGIDQSDVLLGRVVEEGDSPKIKTACDIARTNARSGRKTVIWSMFRSTIDRLDANLSELNPGTLHGGVPTGSNTDLETREGRIKRFHEDSEAYVIIANPAACSEGISLHKACHNAVYLDRSYNAAHYLQSIDRIHRLGLAHDVDTVITILQSVAPHRVGSIDHSVSRRLLAKMKMMEDVLEDEDIRLLALDEQEAAPPIESDTTIEDLVDLLNQLTNQVIPDESEQL